MGKAKKKLLDTNHPNPAIEVARQLLKAISGVNPSVRSVIGYSVANKTITGICKDAKNRFIQFKITPNNKISYVLVKITRNDADRDQCQRGTPCGLGCVQAGDRCHANLTPVGESAVKIVRQAVSEGIAPASAGAMVTRVIATGELPSRAELGGKLATATIKNPGVQEVAGMTAAGMIGGAIGGSVGGIPGSIVGSTVATAVARKGLSDMEALRRAKANLSHDEAYQTASKLQQLKRLGAETLSEMRSPEFKKEFAQKMTGSVAGAIVGSALGAVPVVGVPLSIAAGIAAEEQGKKSAKMMQEGASLRDVAKDIVETPGRIVEAGNQREQQLRSVVARTTGQTVPTRGEIARQSGQKAKEFAETETGKDLIVNTGGFIGSKVGGAVGGLPGALAGDLAGALVVRAVITAKEVAAKVKEKTAYNVNYRTANNLEKAQTLGRLAGEELKSMGAIDPVTGDVIGWAVGNTVAETLPVPIPFRGAIAAMKTVPGAVDDIRRIRDGESAGTVLRERRDKIKAAIASGAEQAKNLLTKGGITKAVAKEIAKGNERERTARRLIREKILVTTNK